MEAGTIDDPRSLDIEGSFAEARDALAPQVERIREITRNVREARLADVSTEDAHRAQQLVARLDVVTRDMEDSLRILDGDPTASLRDEPSPRPRPLGQEAWRILEAQEQERSRLAEELHDGPAQSLANASFQVEIIERALRTDPAAARKELVDLRAQLERELDRLRGFIHQLRPALEEEGGLSIAIGELAEQLHTETGVEVRLQLEAPEERLDLASRTAVLRITQETLRNVRKHAAAHLVTIVTSVRTEPEHQVPEAWVLEVHDDGRGFSQDATPERGQRRHFGLRFMRERAMLVGGRLEIERGAVRWHHGPDGAGPEGEE